MAYDPSQPVRLLVEIYIPPLGWVDITARGRAASCTIRQGRSADSIQAETSQLSLELGNPDGWLTEDNPLSPWYGYWQRGCEIRVSRLGLAVSPAERFHGQVDTIVEHYPGGDRDATVEITAIGTLGILTQGTDTLRSPMYRSILGDGPSAYYPLEDGPGTTQFASALMGAPAVTGTISGAGSVTAAGFSTLAGSAPVPSLSPGAKIIATVPAYTDTGVIAVQLAIYAGTAASNGLDVLVTMTSGAVIDATFIPNGPLIFLNVKNPAGTSLVSQLDPITSLADCVGKWILLEIVGVKATGAWAMRLRGQDGTVLRTLSGTGGAAAYGVARTIQISAVEGSGTGDVGAGHLQVFGFDTSVSGAGPYFGSTALAVASAMRGHAGELAANRMGRLCREAGVAFELAGNASRTAPMGPQLFDTTAANLRDCENTDQGLLHDYGTGGAVGYVTSSRLYNQSATVAVVRGSVEPGLEAIRDNRYTRNDVTSRRPGGGSAHWSDEDHIAKYRARIKGPRDPNVAADAQLFNDAAWAVHVGTAPGARYNSLGINLRNADGALLADQVAAHRIGDRFTVAKTALPPQHVDGIDGLTVGWTEVLDADTWIFRPNVVPYSPYEVGVYNDTVKRYGSRTSRLVSAVNSSAASLSVIWDADDAQWITGSAGPVFPFDGGSEGERIRVDSITSAASDDFQRSVSNNWGTAPSGQAWTVQGVATQYSVNGTDGIVTPSVVNTDCGCVLDTGSPDQVVQVELSTLTTPVGAGTEYGLYLRYTDANNHYRIYAAVAVTTGAITLTIAKRVAGSLSTVTSLAVPMTMSARKVLKAAVVGSDIRAKIWESSATSEPYGWQLAASDASLAAGNLAGCAFRRATGNTSPTAAGFDNFRVVGPQVWGVTRSRNGVVKSHPAGAKVTLWTPAVYAY